MTAKLLAEINNISIQAKCVSQKLGEIINNPNNLQKNPSSSFPTNYSMPPISQYCPPPITTPSKPQASTCPSLPPCPQAIPAPPQFPLSPCKPNQQPLLTSNYTTKNPLQQGLTRCPPISGQLSQPGTSWPQQTPQSGRFGSVQPGQNGGGQMQTLPQTNRCCCQQNDWQQQNGQPQQNGWQQQYGQQRNGQQQQNGTQQYGPQQQQNGAQQYGQQQQNGMQQQYTQQQQQKNGMQQQYGQQQNGMQQPYGQQQKISPCQPYNQQQQCSQNQYGNEQQFGQQQQQNYTPQQQTQQQDNIKQKCSKCGCCCCPQQQQYTKPRPKPMDCLQQSKQQKYAPSANPCCPPSSPTQDFPATQKPLNQPGCFPPLPRSNQNASSNQCCGQFASGQVTQGSSRPQEQQNEWGPQKGGQPAGCTAQEPAQPPTEQGDNCQSLIELTEVHPCGSYIKLINKSCTKAEYISGYMIVQMQCGHCICVYKIPPCTYVGAQCSVRVWAADSDPGCYKLPSDLVFRELCRWAAAPDIITAIYKFDGQGLSCLQGCGVVCPSIGSDNID